MGGTGLVTSPEHLHMHRAMSPWGLILETGQWPEKASLELLGTSDSPSLWPMFSSYFTREKAKKANLSKERLSDASRCF